MDVHLYVDGSCHYFDEKGDRKIPDMGAGIVILFPESGDVIWYQEKTGKGGSNVAELLAVEAGLKKLNLLRHHLDVKVFSDSSYAVTHLSKEPKTITNKAKPSVVARHERVTRIRHLMGKFKSVEFRLIARCSNDHSTLADELAKTAAKAKSDKELRQSFDVWVDKSKAK